MAKKKYIPPVLTEQQIILAAHKALADLARKLGVAPMTLDQFEAEHARMAAAYVRAQADEKSKNSTNRRPGGLAAISTSSAQPPGGAVDESAGPGDDLAHGR